MSLFAKKPKMTNCPICRDQFESSGKLEHWESHVSQIPEGHGEATGQYTWECSCGPAGMKWPKVFGASAGLAMHMMERHGIAL
jgi:hypothetical protein